LRVLYILSSDVWCRATCSRSQRSSSCAERRSLHTRSSRGSSESIARACQTARGWIRGMCYLKLTRKLCRRQCCRRQGRDRPGGFQNSSSSNSLTSTTALQTHPLLSRPIKPPSRCSRGMPTHTDDLFRAIVMILTMRSQRCRAGSPPGHSPYDLLPIRLPAQSLRAGHLTAIREHWCPPHRQDPSDHWCRRGR